MSVRVVARLGIVSYISIRIHTTSTGLYVIRTNKTTYQGVIVAEVIIKQPRLAIQTFAGIVERGGHAAPLVVNGAVGAVVLQADDLSGIVKGHAVAAQRITEQGIERRPTDAPDEANKLPEEARSPV